jgi:hypothetical protein
MSARWPTRITEKEFFLLRDVLHKLVAEDSTITADTPAEKIIARCPGLTESGLNIARMVEDAMAAAGKVKVAAPVEEPPTKPKPAPRSVKVSAPRIKKEKTPEQLAAIEKAARRRAKLRADVPKMFMYAPAAIEWVHYPGMPELLVNQYKDAMLPKDTRRRGKFYQNVPRQKWNGREFWRVRRGGKLIRISVGKAMVECGFWPERIKAVAG